MLRSEHVPLKLLLDLASDGMALVEACPWRIVWANATLARWIDRRPEQCLESPLGEIVRTDPPVELLGCLERVLRGGATVRSIPAELVSRENHGTGLPVEMHMKHVQHGGQACVGLLVRRVAVDGAVPAASTPSGAFSPVSGGFIARTDPLTGLPDRSVLMARLSTLLAGHRSADRSFAVLFIDLDGFKQVNDRYGHLVGDRVLAETASRLAECTRAGDLLVRYGGDEFVILVEEATSWEEFAPVVDRIHAALAGPVSLPECEVSVSASVGVAEAQAQHRTPEDLLWEADRAMYAAKRRTDNLLVSR